MPGVASEGVAPTASRSPGRKGGRHRRTGVPQPGEYGDRLVTYCPYPVEEGVRIAAGMIEGPFEVVDYRQPLAALFGRGLRLVAGHLTSTRFLKLSRSASARRSWASRATSPSG